MRRRRGCSRCGWGGCWPRWPRAAGPAASGRVLDAAERDQVLAGWNDTAAAVPAATLPELFAARAARTPDAVAVVCGDVHVSYGELDARAGRLAGCWPAGVRGRSRWWRLCWTAAASWLRRSLGVWQAGAAYLPLDPGYPPSRLAFMLADSRARVLVTGRGAGRRRACGEVERLGRADDLGPLPDVACRSVPGGCRCGGAGGVRDLYVGVDRGAEGRGGHPGGLANLAAAHGAVCWCRLAGKYGCCSSRRSGFDASVLELAVALPAGAALVVAAAGERAGRVGWRRWCAVAGYGRASVVPSLLAVLDPRGSAGVGRGCWWAGRLRRRRWRRGGRPGGGGQYLRADRGHGDGRGRGLDRRGRGAAGRLAAGEYPGVRAGRVAVPGARRGWPGSCTSRGRSWRAVTWAGAGLTAERFVACPFGGRGSGCTGPGTWPGGRRWAAGVRRARR